MFRRLILFILCSIGFTAFSQEKTIVNVRAASGVPNNGGSVFQITDGGVVCNIMINAGSGQSYRIDCKGSKKSASQDFPLYILGTARTASEAKVSIEKFRVNGNSFCYSLRAQPMSEVFTDISCVID